MDIGIGTRAYIYAAGKVRGSYYSYPTCLIDIPICDNALSTLLILIPFCSMVFPPIPL